MRDLLIALFGGVFFVFGFLFLMQIMTGISEAQVQHLLEENRVSMRAFNCKQLSRDSSVIFAVPFEVRNIGSDAYAENIDSKFVWISCGKTER